MSLSSNSSDHLRRVRDDIPVRLWIVASISFWEKAAFWGLTAPWQNYMQHPARLTHEETPGALGLGQVKATRIYCAFYIAYYVSPILFAVLSDSRLGRYRTLFVCLILFNLGCAAMTFSSLPSSLAAGWGLPGLIIAMICVALGGGGFESNMAAFLADQYAETDPRIKVLSSGEEVVTDRVLTIEYIYSLNYWLGNVGSLSWFAVVALEEHVSFAAAYGLCLGFVFISLLTLLAGRGYFLRVPHESKIFTQASQILLCACRSGFRLTRTEPEYQLEHHRKVVPWSGQLVHELRRALQGCRVLLAFIVFYICFDQMQNNLISQSAQMETSGTPNDMLPAMNQVGCILFTPLIHHIIYPLLHKRHVYLKPITRITIGFGFVVSSMAYAAIVQNVIYSSGPCYDHPRACSSVANREPNLVNVWIQAPVFFLIAMGEVWAYVTALEIAYNHAPRNMKSMIQAIFPLMAGIGSASAMGLTTFAHDPNLVIFYALLAGGMAVTTVVFWLVFRKHDRNDAGDKSDAHVDIGDTPSTRRSERTSMIADFIPEPEHVDMELGLISLPYANSGLVSPEQSNLTSKTLVSQKHGIGVEVNGSHFGPGASTDEPVPGQQAPALVPEAAHPIQLPPSPPRSPSKSTRKLQKRQPRFSMVS
ncbi:peptide transporter PTR2-A [Paraphaeosphaeria sporulosa]|uniref:Peptide transporter PTR2-A n=1 Tax=Paraphaeosphaeria sporulosa TaxID=1460663 RepID=A0A177CCH7_9PLEO|nr:peptide transporter PTR2-A [Paraphaeosphaeria sporulosa]OAG04592.1 peptide transporter PTR2-A [Paraphaeosphaeria sporulosa]